MKKVIATIALVLFATVTIAQERKPLFIGIQPAVTKEKFYSKNEFDLNVIPIVFQFPVTKRVDLRMTTLGNYHFGNERQFSDLGLELATPIFLKKKAETNTRSKGFFLSPVINVGRNILRNHGTLTFAAEGGYFFLTSKRFALSAQIQYGASFFVHDAKEDEWLSHFGIKVNIGGWLF